MQGDGTTSLVLCSGALHLDPAAAVVGILVGEPGAKGVHVPPCIESMLLILGHAIKRILHTNAGFNQVGRTNGRARRKGSRKATTESARHRPSRWLALRTLAQHSISSKRSWSRHGPLSSTGKEEAASILRGCECEGRACECEGRACERLSCERQFTREACMQQACI